jgi:hypothetical protein
MDDLYNAVEDVRLINAMTDEPRPTKEWILPSPTEVKHVSSFDILNPFT